MTADQAIWYREELEPLLDSLLVAKRDYPPESIAESVAISHLKEKLCRAIANAPSIRATARPR